MLPPIQNFRLVGGVVLSWQAFLAHFEAIFAICQLIYEVPKNGHNMCLIMSVGGTIQNFRLVSVVVLF